MTAVALCALVFGRGVVGCWRSLQRAPLPFSPSGGAPSRVGRTERSGGRTAGPTAAEVPDSGIPGFTGSLSRWLPFLAATQEVGHRIATVVEKRELLAPPRGRQFRNALELTGQTLDQVVSTSLVDAGIGLLLPPVLWIVMAAGGIEVPLVVPVVLSLVSVPLGASIPALSVLAEARERRRHFRVVVGSFVDLVVLSLAGGVGIEGALQAAASVSSDWASTRIARVLQRARDSGDSPWEALGRLGERCGVAELTELAATLGLAGTEGARIRQALSARAASFRRHEQAEAESAANSMTERLFLPGALLLIGVLLFVGYPAFSRILTGF